VPILGPHQQAVGELLLERERDLLQKLADPTEQSLVVQPLVAQADSGLGGDLGAGVCPEPDD